MQLSTGLNFRSLSVKDLLHARDLYHWHLSNKANVVGTAVGLYLIRKTDPDGTQGGKHVEYESNIRTFENSEVLPYSWPAIIVLVRDWVEATSFGHSGVDPNHMIPSALYLPDGRAVPVCVVAVETAESIQAAPADVRWPASYVGGGCPLIARVQGAEHVASVGCLVSDGHTMYALTNRHVCGEAGTPIMASLRGDVSEIGTSSGRQLTRMAFEDVFPDFTGTRSYLTLDIGLVEVANVNDWKSQPFGLTGAVGETADLNELTMSLELIDQPVTAFGASSGLLEGKIKALFYRHKSVSGYDYISQFLIAPERKRQTAPGDSGTVWYLTTGNGSSRVLHPLAVEWGGQTVLGSGGKRLNYALATGLSTVCRLLDVDLVRTHNTGANEYWGQTGHYNIATAATKAVHNADLKKFLEANLERISFAPDALTPAQIRVKLANGDFVELADVPDLVWKKTPDDTLGGRDYARNAGPEHPNHYADIDDPGSNGTTLRDLTLASVDNMSVEVWRDWYRQNGKTDPRHQGLLPFRVWQIFDEMVRCLKSRQDSRFLCAAGVLAHYVGDACQPLHGSYRSDGYQNAEGATRAKWPGKGVHSTYENKMVDRHSDELLANIGPAAASFHGTIYSIRAGHDAAFATVELMAGVAAVLPPTELCDEYIHLGGGTSVHVVDGLWEKFGNQTSTVMGIGARYLAAIWDAAFELAGEALPDSGRQIPEKALAKIYQNKEFVPSLTLDKIGQVLEPQEGQQAA